MFNAKFDEFGSPEMENDADDFEAQREILRQIAEDEALEVLALINDVEKSDFGRL